MFQIEAINNKHFNLNHNFFYFYKFMISVKKLYGVNDLKVDKFEFKNNLDLTRFDCYRKLCEIYAKKTKTIQTKVKLLTK